MIAVLVTLLIVETNKNNLGEEFDLQSVMVGMRIRENTK